MKQVLINLRHLRSFSHAPTYRHNTPTSSYRPSGAKWEEREEPLCKYNPAIGGYRPQAGVGRLYNSVARRAECKVDLPPSLPVHPADMYPIAPASRSSLPSKRCLGSPPTGKEPDSTSSTTSSACAPEIPHTRGMRTSCTCSTISSPFPRGPDFRVKIGDGAKAKRRLRRVGCVPDAESERASSRSGKGKQQRPAVLCKLMLDFHCILAH